MIAIFARNRRGARLVRLVVPVALLLIAAPLVGARGVPPQAPRPALSDTAPSFALYRPTDFLPTDGYAAIDPRTLTDLPGSATLRIGNGTGWTIVSGDGSTAAVFEYGEVAIWDVRAGGERARFSVNGSVATLSHDGARLVTSTDGPPPSNWDIYDTVTGRISLIVPEEPTGTQGFLFDDVALRMYRLYYSGSPSKSTRIVATNLTTGEHLGEVTVPDLQAGAWSIDQSVRGQETLSNYVPGLALSPDGRRMAIVHPTRNVVTLINTHPLQADQTVAFGRRPSRWQRLVALLPLWPQSAEAKGSGGVWRQAVFAADGRHLYVFGNRYTLDGQQVVADGLGLAAVDLKSGAATQPILTNERIDCVLPAPDGQGVYVGSFSANGRYPVTTFHLRRLAATTLRPLAERDIERYGPLLLIPAVPNTA